jgi:putative transposase
MTVKLTEESYTSKASFLDRDPLPVWSPKDGTKYTFSGRRVERGLYRASDQRDINVDLNGAYNIVRKVTPGAFVAEGVEDGKGNPLVVHPVRITLANPKKASGQ